MSCRIGKWFKNDEATAAIEAGLLFPAMVAILCGMMDIGVELVTNQKVINASQMVADLLTRQETVSDADITDAIAAARMALQPYDTLTLGVDVAGVQFIGASLTPTVQWRTTVNMTPNDDILIESAGLGAQDEGVVAATVHYTYTPFFTSILIGPVQLQEVSYARGRRSLFVTKV